MKNPTITINKTITYFVNSYKSRFSQRFLKKTLPENLGDINAHNSDGNTHLINAVLDGDVAVAKHLLLVGADVNLGDKTGNWTPLMWAAFESNAEMTTLLLTYGADPAIQNVKGSTSLMLAISSVNRNEVIIDTLIAHMRDQNGLDKQNKYGQTALMLATRHALTGVIQALVLKGANINTADKDGYTALMFAAENNYLDAISLYMESGADYTMQSVRRKTALKLAYLHNNEDAAALLQSHIVTRVKEALFASQANKDFLLKKEPKRLRL